MAKIAGWPPRHLTRVPAAEVKAGDGALFQEFIEATCRLTKDSIAGKAGSPMLLRSWQAELLAQLFARTKGGRLRHRQALVGVARKNGKSALAAGIGLAGLVLGPDGGEVYSCAADREQARIVFGTAKRMVELDPELNNLLTLYRDAIEYKRTGSIYRVLSAESYTKEGLNPHLVLFDEVHAQPSRDLWDVMALAMGARVEPILLGITTAGVRTDSNGGDSLCYSLYEYGKRVASGEVDDPTFFLSWWEPTDALADFHSPVTWRAANPGLADLVAVADFRSTVLRTPENMFRMKRCNQWVSTARAWLPDGAFEARTADVRLEPGDDVVLAVDGSYNNDSTAIIIATVGEVPHIAVGGIWERPEDAGIEWTVPILEVEERIRDLCSIYNVTGVFFDPFRWARTMEVLADPANGVPLPVVSFPQTSTRMVPATARFYEAAVNGFFTHDGNPALIRHVRNCRVHETAAGQMVKKEARASNRKIDLAVTAIMALDRASIPEEVDMGVQVW